MNSKYRVTCKMRSNTDYSDVIPEFQEAMHPDMAKVEINKRHPKRHAIDIQIEDISLERGSLAGKPMVPSFSKEKSWKKELLK